MINNYIKYKSGLLDKMYGSSDRTRYLLLLATGMVHVVFSFTMFMLLEKYILILISLAGAVLFYFLYKLFDIKNYVKVFYIILVYAFTIELTSSFYLEWDIGFQNFLFALIPLSFAFLYLNDNYEKIIPIGIKCSVIVLFCYLSCIIIDFIVNPVSGATNLQIYIFNTVISIIIFMMMFIYMLTFVIELYSTYRVVDKQTRNKIDDMNTTMMLSQIKPHFIYNTLGAIADMIETNPQQAIKEMNNFSRYLRRNIDILSSSDLVTFEQERSHIDTFLKIQNMRFENTITITYNIGPKDFLLPPITIQPLVENSIRHGIQPKGISGEIIITTEENDDNYLVTVIDNGKGFTKHNNLNNEESIGLSNIEYRLKTLCNGTMSIDSKINIGTTVTLTIPKG
ncbi:MAG: histidine kinase, partial [Erysipelotrichaceae bacterium]